MAVSPLQRAKPAFVIVLQSIAAAYSVQLDVTRESADNLVTSAFRRVAKKVHPDKGGKLVDSQRLLAARQLWEDALRAASANGRPVSGKSSATSSSQFSLSWAAESRREFRIQSGAALLTYQGFNGLDHWRRFVSFVGSSFKRWRVKHWCATLETNTDGTDHAHLMLQFTQVVDRTTRSFMFEGLRRMWRKRCEAASPDLAGNDAYGKQVPLCRAVPLWAGISEGGFATVVFHKSKKLCTVEWADIVNGGKLTNAIRSLSPTKPRGPWWVLCDNETFLRTAVSQAAHKAQGISLWSVPPRSPDLNPFEKFWAWMRRTLRQKDWADLRAGRKALDKKAYQARVRSTCRTKRAQAVAASCAGGLRKVCKEVVAKKGAMARS
ncbi:unnamed protein product [Polarella glacialis]|uniref:Tc1-like transposase DDE domain-containing protein n=1 Tax=Polarella glacialis TaxID=89957 RepID=A0A813KI36_POLGL|nr:unnamed protein product [Polarella glacialis]